jgi:hypothetical protein
LRYYRFKMELPLSPNEVETRIRAATGKPFGFWNSFLRSAGFDDATAPPLLGRVQDLSFWVRPDAKYPKFFVPCIRGRISPTAGGSKVRATIYPRPITLLFLLFWLCDIAYPAFSGRDPLLHTGMAVLVLAGFTPAILGEVMKAKRLLQDVIDQRQLSEEPSPNPAPFGTTS